MSIIFLIQKKRSAHERAKEILTSGEWASGKRWGEDAPKEKVSADSVSLIGTGACGALVHGLEDEFLGDGYIKYILKYAFLSVI